VLAMVVTLTGVLAIAPVLAQVATLTPDDGPVGQSVTVAATGFAGESILSAKFDGVAVTTAPPVIETTVAGAATFAMLIPTATAGIHVVTISDGVNSVNELFTIIPKVSISPKKGPVGTAVTVTGSGFAAGYTVKAYIGGKALGSALSDSTGAVTVEGAVPTLDAGAQDVTGEDLAGYGTNAATKATFTVTPTLTLGPVTGLGGSYVSVSGSGFEAGDTVSMQFAGVPWLSPTAAAYTFTADVEGKIGPTNLVVPASAGAGTTEVKAEDENANEATADFTVTSRPLTITPNSGPMGTRVMITGSSMTSDGTIAVDNLIIGANAWNATEITIDTGGTIAPTTEYVLPGLTYGANFVTATDNMGKTAVGVFTVVRPTLMVTPASGPKGAKVTITGAGWVPNKPVTITFAGEPWPVYADANGNIAALLQVPAPAVPGVNAVSANDGTLGNAAVSAGFTVPAASIAVTPTEGQQGTAITVTGTGFQGYSGISIQIGAYMFPTTPLTSVLGAFTFNSTIPGVAPGSQVVQATDGVGATATTFFIVKQAPETVETALAGIMDKLVIVWDYAAGDWLFYDPSDVAGSDLAGLSAGTGYWLKVSEDCTLIYGGHSYSLNTGWNNIGWLGI
ncbi:MAG: IPT/TIG domain-containing protein, partial [Gammaproteobacteria bacterium]|nr:IPT/TIG domain-containing protein [Gammaproteobacteria bacterium]